MPNELTGWLSGGGWSWAGEPLCSSWLPPPCPSALWVLAQLISVVVLVLVAMLVDDSGTTGRSRCSWTTLARPTVRSPCRLR